jgi:hypothetical protein
VVFCSNEFEVTIKDFFAVSSELEGIKSMWEIALDGKDLGIAHAATIRLNALHQYINTDSLKPKVAKLREDYLR